MDEQERHLLQLLSGKVVNGEILNQNQQKLYDSLLEKSIVALRTISGKLR